MVAETTLILLLPNAYFGLKIIGAFLLGFTVLVLLMRRVNLKYQRRVGAKLTEALKTLRADSLREELRLMDQFCIQNPKKAHLYAGTLFSMLRITDGPEKSELYLDMAKRGLKTRKAGRMLRANFTLELCYHYLLKNDIEMFLLAVKKLKTYHYTDFEKLNRKYGHLSSEHNPTEYKELAFIAKLYVQGPDDEKIEKLLESSSTYYRMIYTFVLMNYYMSKDDEANMIKYKKLLNEFAGDIFPIGWRGSM